MPTIDSPIASSNIPAEDYNQPTTNTPSEGKEANVNTVTSASQFEDLKPTNVVVASPPVEPKENPWDYGPVPVEPTGKRADIPFIYALIIQYSFNVIALL